MYYCQRVSTQLQLTNTLYHIISYHIKHDRVIVFDKRIHTGNLGSRYNSSGDRALPLACRDGEIAFIENMFFERQVAPVTTVTFVSVGYTD